jgi:hypothetical protein
LIAPPKPTGQSYRLVRRFSQLGKRQSASPIHFTS